MESIKNSAEWATLIGALAPFLIALVNQWHWGSDSRRWVALGVSTVLAIGKVIQSGNFDPANWLLTLAAVIGAAQVSYAAFKPVTDQIDQKTTPIKRKRPRPPRGGGSGNMPLAA